MAKNNKYEKFLNNYTIGYKKNPIDPATGIGTITVNKYNSTAQSLTYDRNNETAVETQVLDDWKRDALGSKNAYKHFKKNETGAVIGTIGFAAGAGIYSAMVTGATIITGGPIIAVCAFAAAGAYMIAKAFKNRKKANLLRKDRYFANNETDINTKPSSKQLWGLDENGNEIELKPSKPDVTLNDIGGTSYGEIKSYVKSLNPNHGVGGKIKQLKRKIQRRFP